MKEKFLSLCIDVEAFNLPNEFGTEISKDEMYKVSHQGLNSALELLEEFNVKITFFVTKDMVEMFPEKIALLAHKGHEIALHSVFKEPEEDKIFKELKEQKLFIEDVIGGKIFGHRSHKFLHISLRGLKKIGLVYDNSLHPTYVPGRYCNIFSPRELYKEDGMVEVPVTVTPIFRFPFSCFWFRILKVLYAELCSKFTYLKQDYINIYFHSWEFSEIADVSLKWPYKLLLHNLGNNMIFNFRRYLDWVKKKKILVITMWEYVQNQM